MIIEILGVALSLLYIFLEIKQNRIMWLVGFISSAIYVYVFFQAKFYADMGLNVYYLIASIYGWILWSRNRTDALNEVKAENIPSSLFTIHYSLFIKLLAATTLLFGIMAYLLWNFTDSPVPLGDALTTALSIVATWMLAHKIIEQWWVWIVVNTISMSLYSWRGLYPTAFLFLCYTIASIVGYYSWKKKMP